VERGTRIIVPSSEEASQIIDQIELPTVTWTRLSGWTKDALRLVYVKVDNQFIRGI
jgi:hypothetical protein